MDETISPFRHSSSPYDDEFEAAESPETPKPASMSRRVDDGDASLVGLSYPISDWSEGDISPVQPRLIDVDESGSQLVRSLEQQLNEKDRLIATLNEQHEERLAQVNRRCQALTQQNRLLQSKLQSGLRSYEEQVRAKQERTNAELQVLRERVRFLEKQGPGTREQVRAIKESLQMQNLLVTESLYLEYKAVPEGQRTVQEMVSCAVYEIVQAERAERQSLMAELDGIRARQIEADSERERVLREVDHVRRSSRAREQDLVAEVEHLEAARDRAMRELSEAQARIEGMRVKIESYDAALERVDVLESENNELRKQTTLNSVTIRQLGDERDHHQSRLSEMEQALELLKMDKLYLSKEAEQLTDRIRSLERDKDRYMNKARELRQQKEELVDKLVTVRDEHKAMYDERVDSELTRIKEQTRAELENIRVTQQAAHEREVRGLRESRDFAQAEFERCKSKLDSNKVAYEQLLDEHRKLQSSSETTAQRLRNEIKLKAFELERLGITHEESTAQCRKLELENEKLMQKQQVLTREYHEMQSQASKTQVALETRLQSLHEKLKAYEQLEYELDVAIMHSAEEGPKKGKRGERAQELLSGLAGGMPTTTKRRIQQSILLAQKLLEKQRECDHLQSQLQRMTEAREALDVELKAAKKQLSRVSQPYNYLIEDLRRKEEAARDAESSARRLGRELEALRVEHERALDVQARMQRDLSNILSSTKNVDSLKSMIAELKTKGRKVRRVRRSSKKTPKAESGDGTVPRWYRKLASSTLSS